MSAGFGNWRILFGPICLPIKEIKSFINRKNFMERRSSGWIGLWNPLLVFSLFASCSLLPFCGSLQFPPLLIWLRFDLIWKKAPCWVFPYLQFSIFDQFEAPFKGLVFPWILGIIIRPFGSLNNWTYSRFFWNWF